MSERGGGGHGEVAQHAQRREQRHAADGGAHTHHAFDLLVGELANREVCQRIAGQIGVCFGEDAQDCLVKLWACGTKVKTSNSCDGVAISGVIGTYLA